MSDYSLKELGAEFTANFKEVPNMGLMFACPNCGMFGGINFDPNDGRPLWTKNGNDIEILSCTPSVLMRGHFHSWIKNGKLCVDSPFSCQKRAEENVV